MEEQNLALEGIRKKLVGKELSYKEIYAIMDQIAKDKLGDVLTTYFVASGYSEGYTPDELYYLTKAMVETGEKLEFRGIVADKHSIGGVPGARVTLIVVPIIAAAGFKIPKSSSRAITTPAGTADAMESIASVTFTKEQIYKIVEKTNACIVWGGSFKIAPADDEIIKIEEPLLFESYDKIIVSVMAKKVAFGATHVLIDLPYGRNVKIAKEEEAIIVGKKFKVLGEKFGVKVEPFVHKIDEPAGFGIGPLLETRDSLRVLEQDEERPHKLEEIAIEVATKLLTMCLLDANEEIKNRAQKFETVEDWAKDILVSGKALDKFKEIVKAQGGDGDVSSKKLKPAKFQITIGSHIAGRVTRINSKNVTIIAKILGAPHEHKAGIYLCKKIKDMVEKGEDLVIFYSSSESKLDEARDSLEAFPIFEIEK